MQDKENNEVQKLNEEFDKSATAYHRINCEKRTNLNLYLGHHFLKTSDELNRRLEKQGIDKSTRIRVTKNHIYKICEYITNSIISGGSDHDVFPENESELQDQKAAEMHRAVLSKWKHINKFKALTRSMAMDYVVDGEVAVKTFWNPMLGEVIGYEESTDEDGEIKKNPVKTGDVEVERIFAWDLILPENAKSLDQSPWVGYQKMMPTKKLKELAPEEIKDKIQDSSEKTFEVFDPTTGGYNHKKGMTLLREKFIKPCNEHPNGYFYMFNEDSVIYEGDLPEGHPFPIRIVGFTEVPTSPRCVSIIRQLRPLQVNVNYGASQQIITQMTLGQDKLIMLGGADLQYNGSHRGVEKYKTNSLQSPTILPGRSGGQFVEAMNQSIQEMYNIANVPEIGQDKASAQMDAQTALFRSIKDKQRFSIHTEKFIEFVQGILEDVLALKKMYMREEEIVSVTGRTERVNVPEFKSSEKIGYQIRVQEVDENETKILGKHIELISMLQYGGQSMGPEQIALIGRNMPFLNKEEIFQEALIDYETYKNIVLALDRGEQVPVQPFDNTDYLLPKLTSRMRKADFRYLDPMIQENYNMFIQQLQQVKAQQLQQLKLQQSQMIPTTGGNVPLPIYREVPKSNGGTKYERVQIPQDALEYLVAQLEQQGVVTDPVKRMEQATQAQISEMANQQQAQVPVNN